MDRVSKNTHLLKFAFLTFQIPPSIFIFLLLASPLNFRFFIKLSPGLVGAKSRETGHPSLVSELGDALIGHVQFGLKGCHHLSTKKPPDLPSGEPPPKKNSPASVP